MSRPNPTKSRVRVENIDGLMKEKRVTCRDYQACLDHAYTQKWQAFSCLKCDHFSPGTLPTPFRGYVPSESIYLE